MKFMISNVCDAFTQGVGSKVTNSESFCELVLAAFANHDASNDKVAGQHYLILPTTAKEYVSAGVGKKTSDPVDYILRSHRGKVQAFLKRELAAPAESVAVVIYTRAAYEADDEVKNDPREQAELLAQEPTHVIVAVLASAGPKSPLTAHRFVANLAGGNREASTWDADGIRNQAKAIAAYWDEWDVVSD